MLQVKGMPGLECMLIGPRARTDRSELAEEGSRKTTEESMQPTWVTLCTHERPSTKLYLSNT